MYSLSWQPVTWRPGTGSPPHAIGGYSDTGQPGPPAAYPDRGKALASLGPPGGLRLPAGSMLAFLILMAALSHPDCRATGPRILEVDEAVLVAWRRLVSAGQQQRYTYSQPDALIAATAVVHRLVVVTRNVEDFIQAEVPILNPWRE